MLQDFDPETLPPPPKIKLDKIHSQAREIEKVLLRYLNLDLAAGVERVANTVNCVLTRTHYGNVLQTLLQYTVQPMTAKTAKTVAWQLAGRQEELLDGPLVPYTIPSRDEWVAMELAAISRTQKDGKPYFDVSFQIHTGQPAGHLLVKQVPAGWFRWLAYQIGFTRRMQWREEVGDVLRLSFFGWLPADADGRLNFLAWKIDNRMLKENKAVLKKRLRFELNLDDDPCPFNYVIECKDCTCTVCHASYPPA